MPVAAPAVSFRPMLEADLSLLHEWIRMPHVVAWWGRGDAGKSLQDTRSKYLPRLEPDSAVKGYIALLAGAPLGFIQSYVAVECGDGSWEDEIDSGVRGIDQFLADGNKLGQGLGSQMVAAFVRKLFRDPSVTKVQADPDPRNVRAIRCYEKAGFRRIGNVTTPDGLAILMIAERAATKGRER
jgi:aminoglycoside 6'-N-acetyltransferase Ib